jgi:intergrase/recombinase
MKEYEISTISEMDELSNYIVELGTLTGLQTSRQNPLENITDFLCYCKDTINLLGEKEKMVNNYIDEIDEIINSGNKEDKLII